MSHLSQCNSVVVRPITLFVCHALPFLLQHQRGLPRVALFLLPWIQSSRQGCIWVLASKQFVMAVASGKVERVAQLIRACLNNHVGIRGLVERYQRAFEVVYNPKGFDEDDMMLGLLILRLGSARLAGIVHQAKGLPGISTLRSNTIIRPLRASPGMPTPKEIEANIDTLSSETLGGELEATGPVHRILMLDEIAVEHRPRWSDIMNKINVAASNVYSTPHRASENSSNDEDIPPLLSCICGEAVNPSESLDEGILVAWKIAEPNGCVGDSGSTQTWMPTVLSMRRLRNPPRERWKRSGTSFEGVWAGKVPSRGINLDEVWMEERKKALETFGA
ncbi:hypothetical protein B0H10DRAFT_2439426 [Mycena sp. CBHHK59/15]|nr:hypothetical protein B0H10DRAFT_2439426 [Mycena sp. CBHHK59/15]